VLLYRIHAPHGDLRRVFVRGVGGAEYLYRDPFEQVLEAEALKMHATVLPDPGR
jgi:hypothetical protein